MKATLPIFGLASVVALAIAGAKSPGQQVDPASVKGPAGATRVWYGVGSCRNCHTKGFDDPDSALCRGTEVAHWQAEDKHALAFKVLGQERGQRIGRNLGWDVQKKQQCLTCHAAWFEPTAGEKAGNWKAEEGVSCVVCHGPDVVLLPGKDAMPRLGWVDTHGSQNQQFREAWRKLTRATKDADWGMTDLWDPVKRTRLCASCHVGSVEQGRVVTHEMYAAGHPPLPGFEVVTFSNQMPRHWQSLREKNQKNLARAMQLGPTEVELAETHLLALGSLEVLRGNLTMLAAQAATGDWPELAHFDCYACHHELKSKSWRQERGYAGKPGRPQLRPWPTALAELGLVHASTNSGQAAQLLTEFQQRLAKLHAVLDEAPYGQPAGVQREASALVAWMDVQMKRIQDRIAVGPAQGGYSTEASARLLGHLDEIRQRTMPDFDSARQLAWAYHVLHLETASKHDPVARAKVLETMQADAAWKALDSYLVLTLPRGQKELETSFALGLDRIGQFEPRQFFQYLDAAHPRR